MANMDLLSELGLIVYDLNYDEAVAGAVPDLTALDTGSWATSAVMSITWLDYDYTIGAFDTEGLADSIIASLANLNIDTSNIDEAIV